MEEKTEEKYVVQGTCYLWILTWEVVQIRAGWVGWSLVFRFFPLPLQPLKAVAAAVEARKLGFRFKEERLHSSPIRDKVVLNRWAPNRWEWPLDGKWYLASAEAKAVMSSGSFSWLSLLSGSWVYSFDYFYSFKDLPISSLIHRPSFLNILC